MLTQCKIIILIDIDYPKKLYLLKIEMKKLKVILIILVRNGIRAVLIMDLLKWMGNQENSFKVIQIVHLVIIKRKRCIKTYFVKLWKLKIQMIKDIDLAWNKIKQLIYINLKLIKFKINLIKNIKDNFIKLIKKLI